MNHPPRPLNLRKSLEKRQQLPHMRQRTDPSNRRPLAFLSSLATLTAKKATRNQFLLTTVASIFVPPWLFSFWATFFLICCLFFFSVFDFGKKKKPKKPTEGGELITPAPQPGKPQFLAARGNQGDDDDDDDMDEVIMVKGKRDRASPLPLPPTVTPQQEHRGQSASLPAPVTQHPPPPPAAEKKIEPPEDQVNKLLALLSANPRVKLPLHYLFVVTMFILFFFFFFSLGKSKRARHHGHRTIKITMSSLQFPCRCALSFFRAAAQSRTTS